MKDNDLNKEKALEKIVKFSVLDNFFQEKKSTCINFQFNSGMNFHVIQPFVKNMNIGDFIENGSFSAECKRNEARTDKQNRIVESLVNLTTQEYGNFASSVTVHFYHSAMKLTIQGPGTQVNKMGIC